MSPKISISIGGVTVEAELLRTELAAKILKMLPFEGKTGVWGNEFYFEIPVNYEMKNGTTDLEIGDLAYWPAGKCFCIFFGATPLSNDDKPVPASEVEKFGRIIKDAKKFHYANDASVSIELIKEKK